MIIAVDFDGTLHNGTFPAIGDERPGAARAMQWFADDEHYIIIWTCREGARQTEMVNWLLEHEIPFNRINDHDPREIAKYGSNSRKVYAHLYIDDRQVGGLPDWETIAEWVEKIQKEMDE